MSDQGNIFLTYENLAFSMPLIVVVGSYVSCVCYTQHSAVLNVMPALSSVAGALLLPRIAAAAARSPASSQGSHGRSVGIAAGAGGPPNPSSSDGMHPVASSNAVNRTVVPLPSSPNAPRIYISSLPLFACPAPPPLSHRQPTIGHRHLYRCTARLHLRAVPRNGDRRRRDLRPVPNTAAARRP